jgi:hypothetical protein
VLSCLVALSLMFAAVEPTFAGNDQGFACASVATQVMQQADGDQGHPSGGDQAPGQHCAHCGCHQPAQLAAVLATRTDASILVRFEIADSDRPVRSTTPPSKPPRA